MFNNKIWDIICFASYMIVRYQNMMNIVEHLNEAIHITTIKWNINILREKYIRVILERVVACIQRNAAQYRVHGSI
jgi:hypothetical protein